MEVVLRFLTHLFYPVGWLASLGTLLYVIPCWYVRGLQKFRGGDAPLLELQGVWSFMKSCHFSDWVTLPNSVAVHQMIWACVGGGPKNLEAVGYRPLWMGHRKKCTTSVSVPKGSHLSRLSKVTQFTLGVCDFLLLIHSNCGPDSYCFWDNWWHVEKREFFPTPVFSALAEGVAVKFWAQKLVEWWPDHAVVSIQCQRWRDTNDQKLYISITSRNADEL